MAAPKPGSPEWQEQLNKQIADRDKALREEHPDTDITDVIPPKSEG